MTTTEQQRVDKAGKINYNYKLKDLKGAVSRYQQGKGTKEEILEKFLAVSSHPCSGYVSTGTSNFSKEELAALDILVDNKNTVLKTHNTPEAEFSM